jgi:hypothetical protein
MQRRPGLQRSLVRFPALCTTIDLHVFHQSIWSGQRRKQVMTRSVSLRSRQRTLLIHSTYLCGGS